jgi:hypothetical protein
MTGVSQGVHDDTDESQRPTSAGRGVVVATALVGLLLVGVVILLVVAVVSRVGEQPGLGPQQTLSKDPPAGLTRGGSVVDSRVRRDGSVEVEAWLRTSRPVSRVQLVVPKLPGLSTDARADDVRVAGGRVLVLGARTVGSSGRTYELAAPNRLVYLGYTLHGVTDTRSTVPGRALVRLTSLDVTYPVSATRTVTTVRGVKVLSGACLGRDVTVPVPCGTPAPDGWRVDLRGGSAVDRVEAQVDLRTAR